MIILDNSMYMAGLFEDEKQSFAVNLIHLILSGAQPAIVAPIFFYEAGNTIANAYRRKRIDQPTRDAYYQQIYALPVSIDLMQRIQPVITLAEKHALTIYDASYLEICVRQALPLATLDNQLIKAARAEKILLIYPD